MDATHLGIETVYQDLALADNLDVVANLYLGREEAAPRIPTLGVCSTKRRWSSVRSMCSVSSM
jgi:D-xylose transport system ATP-binding protein